MQRPLSTYIDSDDSLHPFDNRGYYEGRITIDGKADMIKGETIHERLLFRP